MSVFDEIRPYNDGEVTGVLQRLISDEEFLDSVIRFKFGAFGRVFKFALRPLVKLRLNKEVSRIHSVADFQDNIKDYLIKALDTSTSEITVSGIESLDKDSAYLFISNHRDIAMDPALVNLTIYQHGFSTLRIAIGDNLLTKPFTSDLMRLNKSFIVNRSATAPREKLKAARLLSNYIHHSVANDQENVWIAQREGRAKDGLDRTNSAILSMLAMSKQKPQSLGDYISEARVVPVSISYEYDPCDADKARELYQLSQDGAYEKEEHEDVASIARGITGFKGRVHLSFGSPLQGEFENAAAATEALDKEILSNYQLHPSNCIAYEQLEGKSPRVMVADTNGLFIDHDFTEERRIFNARLLEIDEAHRPIFLAGYANPVRDRLSNQ